MALIAKAQKLLSRRLFAALICSVMASAVHADWSYEYYEGEWSVLPDFTALTPVASGNVGTISLSPRLRDELFGLRFTGDITVEADGLYRFATNSDDGSRLSIDGQVVVNNDGLHPPVLQQGSISLTAGTHSVVVEFFERNGGEVLDVTYAPPGGGFAPIPASNILAGPVDPAVSGRWGPVIAWPEIAITAATLPDGRVLTWSSTETNAFPSNREFTHASVFDPADASFLTVDNNFHDMFCAGVSTLEDGTIIASGGNPNDQRTSAFSPATLTWSARANMNFNRWYGTNLTLPSNEIFSTFANAAGNTSERYAPAANTWTQTTGASMQDLLNEQNANNGETTVNSASDMQWWANMSVMPNGNVYHGGPTQTMHVFNPSGTGSVSSLGQALGDRTRMWSNTIAYDVGKLLMVGGSDRTVNPPTTNNAYTVDLNGPTPQITQVAGLNFARTLSNAVTLPSGEVLIVGGNTTGQLFSDVGSVFAAESWNPQTQTWQVLASMDVPRNYHSVALLLKDGRVLAAGGGGCGNCAANHLDGQIFSPPYLFNADGSPAARPSIDTAPGATTAGASFTVQVSGTATKFSLVRLSATTHATNTDQRFVPVASIDEGGGTHTLTMHANPNVLLPGNYWLYVINAEGVPSVGHTLRVERDSTPDPDPQPGIFESSADIGSVALAGRAVEAAGTYTLTASGADIWGNADAFHYARREHTGDGEIVARVQSVSNTNVWTKAGVMFRDSLTAASSMAMVIVRPDGQIAMQWRTSAGAAAAWTGSLVGGNSAGKYVRLVREGNQFTGYFSTVSDTGPWTTIGNVTIAMPNTVQVGLALTSHNNGALATATLDSVAVTVPAPPVDTDGDGVNDADDAFPNDPTETTDTDGDGVGDNADVFPSDPTETADSDGDGVGDNADLFPFDASNGALVARNSSTLIFANDGVTETVWNVNPDNQSVTVTSGSGAKLSEVPVGAAPWALAQAPLTREIWVANKADASLSVIDFATRQVVRTHLLPAGSQPHGLVFAPQSNDLYVVLEATGQLVRVNAVTGAVAASASVGVRPRHVAVTANGQTLYVSRFITPPLPGESTLTVDTSTSGGEVLEIERSTLQVTNTIVLFHVDRPVSEIRGPGLPNYLGAPVVSPDGATVYVPSKQDNILAGSQRGGEPGALTFDQSVRAVTSLVDIASALEVSADRIDHDNAGLATGAAMTSDGDYLLVALETSREVAVISTNGNSQLMRIPVGRAPQGVALSANGHELAVHNFMDRTIGLYDLGTLIDDGTPNVSEIAVTGTVAIETLSAQVLNGKQLFYDAADDRLARDNYMSCASCHNEGDSDGRVWDFGQFGEGLRNTIALQGKGVGHGLIHWSANFDEIQDFENQIRSFALGTGLMSAADFAETSELLGTPKAGRSADLDALAAYLASLTSLANNPNRSGSLSPDAQIGRSLAIANGCAVCHSGSSFTDSATGPLHDIGTLSPSSGASLAGIDTPTLLSLWNTAPYLHNGSAATIAEAIAAHAGNNLTSTQIGQIASLLNELEVGDTIDDSSCSDCVDFIATPTVSYSNQDVAGNVVIEDDGETLALTDNTWRRTNTTYTVTANTVVEFEFSSSSQGEIHGIGLDEDDGLSSNRIFKVHGTQNWGLGDFDTYSGTDFVTYRIPVGQYYTGAAMRLVFVNDFDAGSGNTSRFRNVRLYEDDGGQGGECNDCLDFSQLGTISYSNQDSAGNVQVEDAGAAIVLTDNTWRRTTATFSVSANTVIEFDFQSPSEGEIHAIGFDDNDSLSSNRYFKVHGTQGYAIRDFDNYAGGVRHYRIPVGQYYTGSSMYLVLINDHDSGSGNVSRFSNVRVFQE